MILDKRLRTSYGILIVIIALAALYIDYAWMLPTLPSKIAIGIFAMIAAGMALQNVMRLKGGFGIFMWSSKRGLSAIDEISRRRKGFWHFMVSWGLTLSFGLAAYPLVKNRRDRKAFAVGIASIVFLLVFVSPYIATSFQLINLPAIQAATAQRSTSGPMSMMAYAMLGITVVLGFAGYTFGSIFYNAGSILLSLFMFLSGFGARNAIAQQVPGVAPIIPGLDIPFFAGIVALAVILSIHELSHGVLARIYKVKLHSLGLLVFGIIPVGAFVEPDDKEVHKLSARRQTDIFAAGISANFLATFVFFVLVFVMAEFVTPLAYSYGVVVTGVTNGYPAYGVLKDGMRILSWNGKPVTNISSLSSIAGTDVPGTSVAVGTNKGTFTFTSVASADNSSRGLIGVNVGYAPLLDTTLARAVHFLFVVLSLSLLLNFLVAVVNLLPIPGFDGWHIYKSSLKNKTLVNVLAAVMVVSIILNAVPWIFYL